VVDLQVTATEGQLLATLHVAPGYHIMSDHPSKPNYIPTRLSLDITEGVSFDDAQYPTPASFLLGDQTIAVFEGDIHVTLPLRAAQQVKRVTGSLKYQACTTDHCLFPTSKAFAVDLASK
jgi:DsbC/DsbD-like thiol-disulfide interchange protein